VGVGVQLASVQAAASADGHARALQTITRTSAPTELTPAPASSRLQTAIAQAVDRSERDASYRAQRQAAERETDAVARERWSPDVRVLGGGTLVGGGISRNGLERTEDSDAGAYAGVGANLTLYDHGRNAVDRELAALGTQRADLDREQAAADIAGEVRDAYYNARLAQAHLADLRALRGQLADWQAMAARQYEARLITSDTRDAVATALQRVDTRIANLEQRLDGERRRWRALTGRDDDPAAGVDGWPAPRAGVQGAALQTAIDRSPAAQRRAVAVRAAELRLEEARRAFGPAVDLSANAVQGLGGEQGVFVGLTGSWPVFDNGVRGAREDAAVAELSGARAARRAETDRLRRETGGVADELARLQEEAAADRAIARDAEGRLRQVARRFRAEEAGFDALAIAARRYAAALNSRYVTLRQSVTAENRQLTALGLRGASNSGDPATDS
jgi:outer membrane protein TolC